MCGCAGEGGREGGREGEGENKVLAGLLYRIEGGEYSSRMAENIALGWQL